MTTYNKSEENIIFSFIIVALLIVLVAIVSVYKIVELSDITQKFQKHPLTVINSTQNIKTNIVSMHRYMKDVVLSENEDELQDALLKVNENEKTVYKDFKIVFDNYLGNKTQIQNSYDLFVAWKSIRSEIVGLLHKGKVKEAIYITKHNGYKHVKRLTSSVDILSANAHKKGKSFAKKAEATKDISISIIIAVVMIILLVVTSIVVILLKTLDKDEIQRKDKEQQLIAQSRLAQIGEMISMIAHQWRQPLGAIASTSIDMQMKMELEIYDLDDESQRKVFTSYITNGLEQIDEFVLTLTSTIDDFRDFYKPNKKLTHSQISEPIEKTLNIIMNSLKANNISLIQRYDSKKKINYFSSEIMQVLLNIFKNSEDNFLQKGIEEATIWITTTDTTSGLCVEICDNGGGIDAKIISQVFDPYFSTKDKKNGTGLGLYMSKTIIQEHHNGKLRVKNTDSGVCFTIILKDDLDDNL